MITYVFQKYSILKYSIYIFLKKQLFIVFSVYKENFAAQ